MHNSLLSGADYLVIVLYNVILIGIGLYLAKKKVKSAADFTTASQSLGTCSPTVGIIIGASIIVLFTFFSGMWGSAVTNSLQSIFILIVCVVIVPLTAANAAGGLSTAMANVNPEQLSMDGAFSMTPIMFFSYMVSYVLNVSCEPSYSKYSLAAKDTKSAVKGQAIACAVCLVVTFWSATPALWIGQIFPEITDGSLFVPRLIATYMPVGIRGIIIAIILSLLITTGNSFLLLLTSSITDDVIRPMKPNMGDKQLLTTSRVIIAAGAAIIAALAIVVPDIVTAFKIGGNAFGPVVAIPVLLGFFWKKLNSKAVAYAMIIGCASSVILDIVFIAMGQGAIGNIFACAISLVICVAGSLSMNGKASAAA